jgi:hypothetical protein
LKVVLNTITLTLTLQDENKLNKNKSYTETREEFIGPWQWLWKSMESRVGQQYLAFCSQCQQNFSYIWSWQSDLLVEEPEYLEKITDLHKSLPNIIIKCCSEYTTLWVGFELTILVVIGIDCMVSCKSNYHTITTTPYRPEYEWYICCWTIN